MRPSAGEPPTSDPTQMAQLAVEAWSKIWAARPRGEECIEPEAYYGDFRRTIPPGVVPTVPGVSELEEAIMASNNSSPGPDGVPFKAYRVTCKHAAPVLALVARSLAAGEAPPDGFNHGILFLIPKKGTLLPLDHRPISVTNADNRIVAQAFVVAITPALVAILHVAQKGFLAGRFFEEHILYLNEHFYEIVEGSDPLADYYILFMDTAKAFDSIDHDFIHVAVERAGLPEWFSNAYSLGCY